MISFGCRFRHGRTDQHKVQCYLMTPEVWQIIYTLAVLGFATSLLSEQPLGFLVKVGYQVARRSTLQATLIACLSLRVSSFYGVKADCLKEVKSQRTKQSVTCKQTCVTVFVRMKRYRNFAALSACQ